MSPAPLVSIASTLYGSISTKVIPSKIEAPLAPKVMAKFFAEYFSLSLASKIFSVSVNKHASSILQKSKSTPSPTTSTISFLKYFTILGSENVNATFTPFASAIALDLNIASLPFSEVIKYPSIYKYSEFLIASSSMSLTEKSDVAPKKVFIVRCASGVVITKHFPVIPSPNKLIVVLVVTLFALISSR